MNIRNSITTLALWALFLAPLLCGSGFLTHSCTCEDSTECRHELQCSTDPCQIMALGSHSQNSKSGHSTISVDRMNPPALVDDVMMFPGNGHESMIGPADSIMIVIVPTRSFPLLC